MTKIGDVLKTISTGAGYIVEEISGNEITMCHTEKIIRITILTEDIPLIFNDLEP